MYNSSVLLCNTCPEPGGRASTRAWVAVLTALASATGTQRQRVVEACAAAVMADGEVSAKEGEILRAVADGLGCPLPPFVPTEQTIES